MTGAVQSATALIGVPGSQLIAIMLPALIILSPFQMTLMPRLLRSRMLEILRADYFQFAPPAHERFLFLCLAVRALIGAACLGSFAATSSGTTRAPFLLDMAHDLDVAMPLVANLVSLTATAWGITSALGGWLSDVIGRRPLLIAALSPWRWRWSHRRGPARSSGSRSGPRWAVAAPAPSPASSSPRSRARVPDSQRGRALGWVMSGQSLTLVVGVPMAAAVGSIIGWRGWLVCSSAACRWPPASALYFTVGRGSAGHTRGSAARPSLKAALSPRVLGLLSTGVAERDLLRPRGRSTSPPSCR